MLADTALLDMVFVMDCTGSMGSYIAAAQKTIRDIVQEIVAKEKADVRFALVAYRDHPPQDSSFVTQTFDFSNSVQQMRGSLDRLSANGGGDGPEAVVDGLHAALKLPYRPQATKVCILIADAPPHGLGAGGDGFPAGCPCGLDPLRVCRQMAAEGITLYCIGCEPSLTPHKAFFMALCHLTGGQYCALGDAAQLSAAVVGGVREEISLERIMRQADAHMGELRDDMSEGAKASYLQQQLKAKGLRTNHLKARCSSSSSSSAAPASAPAMLPEAVELSKCADLGALKKTYGGTLAGSGGSGGMVSSSSSLRMAKCKAAPMKRTSLLARAAAPLLRTLGLGGSTADTAATATATAASSSSSSEESASDEMLSDADAGPSYAAPMARAEAAVPSSYAVEEAEVSVEQCSRLMTKLAARNHKA